MTGLKNELQNINDDACHKKQTDVEADYARLDKLMESNTEM